MPPVFAKKVMVAEYFVIRYPIRMNRKPGEDKYLKMYTKMK